MHTAGAAVMAVALLTGATIGATAQDGGGPLSTDEMLAPFVTEEVEPGVLRLTDAPDDYLRLLERAGVMRKPKGVRDPLLRVAPDGTRWLAGLEYKLVPDSPPRKWSVIYSSRDGDSWTLRKRAALPKGGRGPLLDISPDGTVWAAWWHPKRVNEVTVARFGTDGWQALRPRTWLQTVGRSWLGGLYAVDDGGPWLLTREGGRLNRLYHDLDVPGRRQDERAPPVVAVGPDGIAWGLDRGAVTPAEFLRFDGERWEEVPLPRTADGSALVPLEFPPLVTGPDGSVWLAVVVAREPRPDEVSEWIGGCGVAGEWAAGGGLAHFDGTAWDLYLADNCVEWVHLDNDGAAWVRARDHQESEPPYTYVIRPELVEPPTE